MSKRREFVVLHCPVEGDDHVKILEEVVRAIKIGGVVILPNDRDEHGCYLWDVRIEAVGGLHAEVIGKLQGSPGKSS